MQLLNTVPIVLLGAVVIGLCAAFALLGVTTVRRGIRGRVLGGHNEVLTPIFLTAGTIYAVLIGFIVIIVWEQYVTTKADIADEASALTTMYRETTGMPAGEQATMRQIIRAYTTAVANDEWPLQARGSESPLVDRALGDLYRAANALPSSAASSAINTSFMQNASRVAGNRNKRLLQSEDRFPAVLWFGLILGGALVVAMTFFLFMEHFGLHVVMSSALAALVGTLLFIVIVLNHPLSGQLAIGPQDFTRALTTFSSVDGNG